jgi:hypothetical protein
MDSSGGDFWYVKLSDGDVHRVTLDQLDEAFQAGHIDGDTMVLASGSEQWARLAAVAGMDDAEEEPRVEVAPPAPEPEAMYIPQLPRPAFAQTPVHAHAQWAPPVASAPLAYVPQQPVRAIPQPARAIPQPAPYGARPTAQTVVPPALHPSYAPQPNTLRPMSVDFSDSDLEAMRMRRRGGAMRWMVPVLALACIGGTGTYAVKQRPSWAQPLLNRLGYRAETTEVAAATMIPPTPAPPPPPAQPVAPPAPPPAPVVAAPPAGDSPLNPRFSDQTTRLTDDQKARLAEADKAKAKGGSHKGHGGGGAPVSHSGGKGKSTTFTTGGSKYDPLNSSI